MNKNVLSCTFFFLFGGCNSASFFVSLRNPVFMVPLSSLLVPGARVAVVGSRSFPSPSLVESFVVGFPAGVVVVSGGGGVVDLSAAAAARSVGLSVVEFLPDWGRYRRGAGPVRNAALVSGGLSVLVAFASDPECLSAGTADVVRRARAAGVPVFVFGPDGSSPSQTSLFLIYKTPFMKEINAELDLIFQELRDLAYFIETGIEIIRPKK